MKKIIPIAALLIALILTGCKVKTYTPEIADFSQSASVSSGDFSYNCEISRNAEGVTVTATSTKAKGLTVFYNGNSAVFKYLDMEYEINGDKLNAANPAKAVYDVFEYLTSQQTLQASKTADGFRYDGKTSLGSFSVLQYEDYSYKSIVFKDADINIVFN